MTKPDMHPLADAGLVLALLVGAALLLHNVLAGMCVVLFVLMIYLGSQI